MIPLQDDKSRGLREHGTLNPQPQRITDALFCDRDFFDPGDLVQRKYERLRYVRVDGLSVIQAARRFRFFRSAFYQARAAIGGLDLLGLIPRRPGPRRPHKLSDELVTFLIRCRHDDPRQSASALAELVRRHHGLTVHPRSIERALERRQKGQSALPASARSRSPVQSTCGRRVTRRCGGRTCIGRPQRALGGRST